MATIEHDDRAYAAAEKLLPALVQRLDQGGKILPSQIEPIRAALVALAADPVLLIEVFHILAGSRSSEFATAEIKRLRQGVEQLQGKAELGAKIVDDGPVRRGFEVLADYAVHILEGGKPLGWRG